MKTQLYYENGLEISILFAKDNSFYPPDNPDLRAIVNFHKEGREYKEGVSLAIHEEGSYRLYSKYTSEYDMLTQSMEMGIYLFIFWMDLKVYNTKYN